MLVSILIPTYNRAQLIAESIQSVLDQTYTDFEAIVVDDGSTDKTSEIIEGFSDPRLRYVSAEHTGFVSKVRNRALKEAKGELIAFIDSDDLWLPHHLESLVDILKNNSDLGMAFSNIEEFTGNTSLRASLYDQALENKLKKPLNILPMILSCELVIYPTSLMFTRSCIKATGFLNEQLSITETNYIGRAAKDFKAAYSHQTTARVRKHSANHSDDNRGTAFLEMFILLNELKEQRDISHREYRKLTFKYQYRYGIERIECNDPKTAQKAFFEALKIRPWSVKSLTRLVQVTLNRKQIQN